MYGWDYTPEPDVGNTIAGSEIEKLIYYCI